MQVGRTRTVALLAGFVLSLNAMAAGICAVLCQVEDCGAQSVTQSEKSCCEEKKPKDSKSCCEKMSQWSHNDQITLTKSVAPTIDFPILPPPTVYATFDAPSFIEPTFTTGNDRAPPGPTLDIHAIRGPPESLA